MIKKALPSSEMVATKNKVLSCSTPEQRQESPSRDSDSLCDSDAASPVPFLCTQDGAEGETDVVWNFYTPKSEHAPTSRFKNSTPLSRKAKKSLKHKLNEKSLPKRRPLRATQKRSELFQDLIELNQNLHELISKKPSNSLDKPQSGSEEDIFNNSGDSPKGLRHNSRCLRRNVLSTNFCKPETETALESDDSMNECLIKASQVVEDKILSEPTSAKRPCVHSKAVKEFKPQLNIKMDHDSMDAILNSIKLDSPFTKNGKKCDSPLVNNDSFDNYFGNLNESALEQLTQMPVKNNVGNRNKLSISKEYSDWTVQELVVHDASPSSKSFFGRHNSMPESPSVSDLNKPSTSGMVLGRYSSMPYNKNSSTGSGDSPIRCTPDEIKKKHQQAREKLLAKRQLPFTSTQTAQPLAVQSSHQTVTRNTVFQPKVASSAIKLQSNIVNVTNNNSKLESSNNLDLRSLIEKKRQEAVMKLRRRQPQNKML